MNIPEEELITEDMIADMEEACAEEAERNLEEADYRWWTELPDD